MNVPVATSGERSMSINCSIAAGGGNTNGKKKNPSATPKAVPSTPPIRKIASPRHNPMNAPSAAPGQARHGEPEAAVGKLAPRLHSSHVGGLGEAGKPPARLLARRFARQRKGLAAEAVEPVAPRQRIGSTSGKVAWARGFHG